jgi:hypothetical protein
MTETDTDTTTDGARSCPLPTEASVCIDCEDDGGQCGTNCEFWPCCMRDWEKRVKAGA